MNVHEIHIEINQSLQQVAANKGRKFYAEEIDWAFNKMVTRFIQLKIRPKEQKPYRKDQLDIDGLRDLFVSQKEITPYVASGLLNRMATPLPSDYYHVVEDNSGVVELCGSTTAQASIVTETLTYLELSDSPLSSAPYYTSLVLTVGGTTINIPSDLNGGTYNGYQNKSDSIFLKSFIISKLREAGFKVYWEKYDDIYKQNNLIIIGDYTPTLVIDDTNVTQTSTSTRSRTIYTNPTKKVTPNRLTWETLGSLRNTPFHKPHIESPLSELSNQVLYTYYSENFTVTTTLLSYIRKPRLVSLSLNSDCEIGEAFHQTLCDMTVEYIKGRVGDGPGYQLTGNDNTNRVNL